MANLVVAAGNTNQIAFNAETKIQSCLCLNELINDPDFNTPEIQRAIDENDSGLFRIHVVKVLKQKIQSGVVFTQKNHYQELLNSLDRIDLFTSVKVGRVVNGIGRTFLSPLNVFKEVSFAPLRHLLLTLSFPFTLVGKILMAIGHFFDNDSMSVMSHDIYSSKLCEQAIRGFRAEMEQLEIPTYEAILPLYTRAKEQLAEIKTLNLVDSQKAKIMGKFTRLFIDLDNLYSLAENKSMHAFCGCQFEASDNLDKQRHLDVPIMLNIREAQDQLLTIPQHEFDSKHPFFGISVGSLIHDCGIGHVTMQRSMAEQVGIHGAHVYYGDGPEQIGLHVDTLYKKLSPLGVKKTSYDFVRFLCEHPNSTAWLRKLLVDGAPPPSDVEKEKLIPLFIQHFLERDLDLVVNCYGRQADIIHKAGGRAGVPVYMPATDLDSRLHGKLTSDVHPHTYYGIYVDDPKGMVRKSLTLYNPDGAPCFPEDRLLEEGYLVTKPFLDMLEKNVTPEGDSALRQKYSLNNERSLIVMLGGGYTSNTSEMKEIYHSLKKSLFPPTHFIKVCGNCHDAFTFTKNFLDGQCLPHKEVVMTGQVTFYQYEVGEHILTVAGFVPHTILAEMEYTCSTLNKDKQEGAVLCTKGGGGSLREALAMGAQLLIEDTDNLNTGWIQGNIDILTANDWALGYDGAVDRMVQLRKLLTTPRDPAVKQKMVEFGKSFPKKCEEIHKRLLKESKADQAFQRKRKENFDLMTYKK